MYRIIIEDIQDAGMKVRAIRELRNARTELHGDNRFGIVTEEMDRLVRSGEVIIVGDTDDRAQANDIAVALQSVSCIVAVEIRESDEDEVEQWGAVPRTALVLMVASNGDPSLALGFAKSLAHNTDDHDLYVEVAESLMLCVRCGGYGTLRTIPPSDPPLGCPRCDGSGADPGRRLPR